MAEAATAAFKTSDHAEVLSRDGSNYQFKCHHCDKVFNGTATRVLGHISGMGGNISACTQVSTEEKAAAVAYKLSCEAATAARKRQRKEDEQLIEERRSSHHGAGAGPSSSRQGSSSSRPSPVSCQQCMHHSIPTNAQVNWSNDLSCLMQIAAAFARADMTEAHATLADLIYLEGLPITFVKSRYLGRFIAAVQKLSVPYKPPHYNTMRTTLLDSAVERVQQQLEPASACSCERNWSAYDFIHNRRRNRLTADRARKLVYVFTNGRLVNKLATSEETFIGWDEGVEDGSPLEGDEEGT
jgi:hypothetical protein